MTTRRAVEIGLAVGAALGFFVRGSVVHAPPMIVTEAAPMAPAGPLTPDATLAKAIAAMRAGDPDIIVVGEFDQRVDQKPSKVILLDAFVNQDVRLRPQRGDYNSALMEGVDFRGRDLREADLRQATIRGCDFRGANLKHAGLTDATFDEDTRWPEGFDPIEHGICPAVP